MDAMPHATAERFCQHVARFVHPTLLRELLFTARAVDPADPTWDGFVAALLAVSRLHHRPAAPATELIECAIADRSVRDRTRAFLRSAVTADPVDAVQDAELILWLMRERLEEVLADQREPPLR
jgi:hypothetical protein